MPRKRFVLASLVLMLLAAGTALSLGSRLSRAPELHGTLLDPPLPTADFSLTTSGGTNVGARDFRGRLVVLFFGFTHCPDVCPLTMQRLGSAMQQLGDRADQVQVILVSVDPERDPPDRIDTYAKRFHPGFIGVTGTQDELRDVASSFGIFFARSPDGGADVYTVDHSASTLVLDRNGQLRMIWPFDTGTTEMLNDLRYLIRR